MSYMEYVWIFNHTLLDTWEGYEYMNLICHGYKAAIMTPETACLISWVIKYILSIVFKRYE